MVRPLGRELSDVRAVDIEVPAGALPVATARELAVALGAHDVGDLLADQPQLAAAVAELSLAAGKAWSVGVDDHVVLLLRALARVSIEAPDVTSTYAAELVARYRPDRG